MINWFSPPETFLYNLYMHQQPLCILRQQSPFSHMDLSSLVISMGHQPTPSNKKKKKHFRGKTRTKPKRHNERLKLNWQQSSSSSMNIAAAARLYDTVAKRARDTSVPWWLCMCRTPHSAHARTTRNCVNTICSSCAAPHRDRASSFVGRVASRVCRNDVNVCESVLYAYAPLWWYDGCVWWLRACVCVMKRMNCATQQRRRPPRGGTCIYASKGGRER